MEKIWGNEYVYTTAYYSVVILCIVLFLAVFELVTKYKNWEEIKNGNVCSCDGHRRKNIWNIQRFSPLHCSQ